MPSAASPRALAAGLVLILAGGGIGIVVGRSGNPTTTVVEQVTTFRTVTAERTLPSGAVPGPRSVDAADGSAFGATYCTKHGKMLMRGAAGYSEIELTAYEVAERYGIDKQAVEAIAEACAQVLPDPGE